MHVLVTGGTGFLGRYIARALLDQGDTVTIMGRDFSQVQDLLARGAHAYPGDLRSPSDVLQACNGADAVCHSGALSAPWGRKQDFFKTNVEGTRHVINACIANHVNRLVYISSPSVIFNGQDHENLTESAPYPDHFTSTYAYTKKLGEDIIRSQTTIPHVILRPKALFGPGDTSILPRLIKAARSGRFVRIGAGTNQVDITYVGNAADAVCAALKSPFAEGKIYTITNGEHCNLWEIIEAVLKRLDINMPNRNFSLPAAMIFASLLEGYARLTLKEPSLTRYTVLILARNQTYDISAAQRDLAYKPRVSVAEALQMTLDSL